MIKEAWRAAKHKASTHYKKWGESAITDGLMMWISIAIILIIFLPVMNAVLNSTPKIVTNPLDVGNLSGGGGVLGPAAMNSTQANTYLMVGNSYGLLIVVLIILAAVILLGIVLVWQGLAMMRGTSVKEDITVVVKGARKGAANVKAKAA